MPARLAQLSLAALLLKTGNCSSNTADVAANDAKPNALTPTTLRGAGAPSTIDVTDAISMVRIQDHFGMDDRFVAFSPDGSKFATVVWRGDLERDVNIFSLLVFDVAESLRRPRSNPSPVLSIDFKGDSTDQAATPISQLT